MAFLVNSIYQLFECQAQLNPNHPAIIIKNNIITYKELEKHVAKLSALFLECNLVKNDHVAIALPPSVETIAAMLACLKCGLPYIPLNSDYPDSYLQNILNDAQIAAVITNSEIKVKTVFSKFNIIDVHASLVNERDSFVSAAVNLEDDAYIIYTSGSTGAPKGVVIPQKNILNLMQATQSIYHIGGTDIIPLFHSLAFDFSVWEIYSALFNGACLLIPSPGVKQSMRDYLDYLITNHVTIINLTPSMFYHLLSAMKTTQLNDFKLRLAILGGEIFLPKKGIEWFNLSVAKQAELYNMYGITEGTIHVTAVQITPYMAKENYSDIGKSLTGTKTAILIENQRLAFNDAEGELCIGGLAVAKEYLNHPELTEKKFFSRDGERWFKTGDLVRKLENNLIYLGRIDQLVKIRGFRIDCTEIESLLVDQPGVRNAVVTTFQLSEDDERLVAFLQGRETDIDINAIKATLTSTLPSFMLPTRFLVLEKFPLTVNGKIDLIKLRQTLHSVTDNKLQLDNSVEDKVINAWRKVLHINNIDLEDNFFDVGGDSLLLLKLQYYLQQTLGKEIPVIDLVRYPTIKKYSDFFRAKNYAI